MCVGLISLELRRILIEIIFLESLWVDHSFRFRKVFVSISFKTYPLFVNQAILQPWKALMILVFVFSIWVFGWMHNLFIFLQDCGWVFFAPHFCVFFIYRWIFTRCDSWLSLFCYIMFSMIFVLKISFFFMLSL